MYSKKPSLLLTVAAFALTFTGQPMNGQESAKPVTAGIRAPTPDYHFPEGTLYRYKAEWHALDAGAVTLRLERGADGTEQVIGAADSTGMAARIYHVHDIYESSFDRSTFCSSAIHKHTEEGMRRREINLRFDYAARKVRADELNQNKDQRRSWETPLPGCALDVLTAVYYTAATLGGPGSTLTFPINDGKKTGDIDVKVTGREQVTVDAGSFNTIITECEPSSELMKNRGKLWVWFSDDAQRVPVKIRGRLRWGTVTLTLQSIERPQATVARPN